MEQATQGAAQEHLPRNRGRPVLLSIFPGHLHSTRGPPSSQGQQEKEMQKATSPKAELQPGKKPENLPRSHGEVGLQKEPVVPGIVDFEPIQEELKTTKPQTLQTPSAYRFGRLSHHSFFSRHHPQPQRVTHFQVTGRKDLKKSLPLTTSFQPPGAPGVQPTDLTPSADISGKSVCMIRDAFSLAALTQPAFLSRCLMGMPTISVPIGDPQSNRNPQLPTYDTWRKNLKDLASRVTVFTKEIESKTDEKEEPPLRDPPPPREQGATYSAETGRLIPASSQALTRRNRQSQRGYPSSKDGGVQTSTLQDQELLILELLCQILQTDSLRAIQFWLLYAPPKEKDLALGLLQTAMAQLIPQPLPSIPAEKLWNHLQDLQEPPQETLQATYSPSLKKTSTPPLSKRDKPEYIGRAQVLLVSSEDPEEKMTKPKAES
ncbi:protein TBATA isoform X2 [Mastomys coucha]|uniref:protein TBATA isoform X2 n=1 Tax=Mastomys coucha TaxID=35658 RepID=UPI00126272C2|nr:protein TBATA isoform X2 [Mastomys coucha]